MHASEIWCKSSQKYILIKLTVKYFNLNLQAYPSLWLTSYFAQGFYLYGCFLVFCLGNIMYFSCTFTSLSRRKEEILTQSPLLCESFEKFPPKCKLLASNNEAILTYWPLKDTFFTFYKCDSAIFKFLNCLDRISLMSYKKYLNDKFLKNELKKSRSRLFFISPECFPSILYL